jgi:hypothetical protein
MPTHTALVQATITAACHLKATRSPSNVHSILSQAAAGYPQSHLQLLRRIYYYLFASLTLSLSGLRLLGLPALILSGACLSLAIICAL